MASMLTQEQLSQYREDGFLLVTEPLLPADEITFVEERVDRLYGRWDTLPRRLTPRPSGETNPPIARINWLNALDPVLAHCQLLETCRGLAAIVLGSNRVWCRFDSAVYKHPGAGNVEWHKDFALTAFGTPKRSVHFWIPLNDHAGEAGTLMFVPGSHRSTIWQEPRWSAVEYLAHRQPFRRRHPGGRSPVGWRFLHLYAVDHAWLRSQSQRPDPQGVGTRVQHWRMVRRPSSGSFLGGRASLSPLGA